ncbi:MAG TPA: Fic family protein, partial [Bacteroidia bacterium]|nr:Fic family protein [Bacteroidia bacterium]
IHFLISENIVKAPEEYRTPVDAAEISSQMKELVNYINSIERKLAVEHAALVHYRILQNQPFEKFNISVALLLMNLILIKHGYPFTMINSDDKKEYFEALDKKDSIYFLQFITKCVLDTSRGILARIKGCLIPTPTPLRRPKASI